MRVFMDAHFVFPFSGDALKLVQRLHGSPCDDGHTTLFDQFLQLLALKTHDLDAPPPGLVPFDHQKLILLIEVDKL
jgi:hypothetical protein